ncbi:uncharacterized protein [Henckelia pumila]|uniref:uncharacterized protein n=1 Tax=Henckelia pumila TaxID=405737 RepID=UPI003C6E048A
MGESANKYPWPSSVNFANYVSVKPWLKDKGKSNDYGLWKEQMICLLESQGLLGFIDGQIPPPSSPIDDLKLWRRTDRLVKGWILGSIGKDLLPKVLAESKGSSREVWLELENIFNHHIQTISHTPEKDYNKYLPLYRAIMRGDWGEAENLLEKDEEARTADIVDSGKTTLYAAVEVGRKSNEFVRKLLDSMPNDVLVRKVSRPRGSTVLHRAAATGNIEGVMMLVNRNPDLLYIVNAWDELPVHVAAVKCHKEIVVHLISVSRGDVPNSPFTGPLGASLLKCVIASGFIDVALDLARNWPELATLPDTAGRYVVVELARSGFAFPSGTHFSWWQKWIYSRISLTLPTKKPTDDIEMNLSSKKFSWFRIICKIPFVKSIKDKKMMHQQALELLKCMCKALESLTSKDASFIYNLAIIEATHKGIHEFVEVIVEMFPLAIYAKDQETGSNIFHVAARKRFENIFNLLYHIDDQIYFFRDSVDSFRNNYMHICGEQASSHKLNLVSGEALQMQRELQWFKEMENFVSVSRRTWNNQARKTPQMLFTEEHQELKYRGEKWMKDTATSCTIAAALIATVVFAAVFTVPGGVENNTGAPVFLKETSFIIFVISDSVSLFTSITSLLMFLAILTSRYAENDFLYVLPQRLCIGLLTLFTSIIFMLVAFSTAIYMTLNGRSHLFFIPVAALACLPVTSFVFLQSPLLIDVMYSTYGPGIFNKKRD